MIFYAKSRGCGKEKRPEELDRLVGILPEDVHGGNDFRQNTAFD